MFGLIAHAKPYNSYNRDAIASIRGTIMTIQRLESFLPLNNGASNQGRKNRESAGQQLMGWAMWFQGRLAKHRSRRALARLDARLLEDAGITEKQRQRELSRSFWD